MYCKLYSSDLGAAITCRGRSLISICALTMEGVLYGYFPKKYDALVYIIGRIKNEEHKYTDYIVEQGLESVKKSLDNVTEKAIHEELVYKVLEHIGITDDYYMFDAIVNRINNLGIRSLIKIFYKNNITAFLNLPDIADIFKSSINTLNDDKRMVGEILDVYDGKYVVSLFDGSEIDIEGKYLISDIEDLSETEFDMLNIKDWDDEKELVSFEKHSCSKDDIGKYIVNTTSVFVNPYEPPEQVKEGIDDLSDMTEQILCGYYWYQGDYIERKDMFTSNPQDTIRSIMRMAIMLIDTDSQNGSTHMKICA